MKSSVLFLLLIVTFLSSCSLFKPVKATKELVYFQNADSIKKAVLFGVYEATIKKNDVLYIGVHSIKNDSAARAYNFQNYYAGASSVNASNTSTIGYLVDNNGDIVYPILGKIHVEGLKKRELSDLIQNRLSQELLDPIVVVRFTNFRVSVLGEVARPSTFDIPDENINLLEAIALAGDLTPYARRDNILIIRDENGVRAFHRINMNDAKSISLESFQLRQDDIVYVEPNMRKLPNSDQSTFRNLTIVTSVISTIALIVTLFRN